MIKRIIGVVCLAWLASCTTSRQMTTIQVLPVQPVLNIGTEKYEIIGEVRGTGTAATYEMARDAAMGAAVLSNKEADALILPRFEATYTEFALPFLNALFPPKYTVVCRAKAIKLRN